VVTRIRLKIELNPGGVGVRLDKLAKISTEVEKFIRLLASDSGATPQPGELLAKDFYEGSFGSVIEYVHNVDPLAATKFNQGLRFFSDFNQSDHINGEYSPATVRQFIEMGTVIDNDEVVRLGIIDPDTPDDKATEWKSITKITTLNVDAVFHQEYKYDGALQGRLGTWYKDSNYFYLRELSSNELVKCFYGVGLYDQIYRLYEDKDAVVNLSGSVTADRATGRVSDVRVHWAKSYPKLSDSEFAKLFGLAPNLTGDLSTSDFIDKMRNGDAEDLH
jgi:hypothetical protein